jgi:arginine N-succinyltransferase
MIDESFVIRPVSLGDLKWFYEVSHKVGIGFTSLVPDKKYLESRLKLSVDSFKQKLPPEQRVYLFVRENLPSHELVGICGVVACVGNNQAFYNYQISTVVQACESLHISLVHTILRLVTNYQHASELISFWVSPEYRGKHISKSLSLCRFLFMAQHLEWFGKEVIAEVRGVCDESGFSPFWDALGKHFFAMDFVEADRLTMTSGKQYISDLVSREPIYYDLLPVAAQKVVGVAHDKSKAARDLLESEGLKFHNHIDIFDGGPLLSAEIEHIKTLVNNRLTTISKCLPNISTGMHAILYNNKTDARFTTAPIIITESGTIEISEQTAKILGLKNEDQIRYCEI